MPYTFVHPVFVMPLKKRLPHLIDFSAILMGSFAPDLDIIYRFTETRHHIFNYSISNILVMILPIAVAMSIYMQLLMIPVYLTGKAAFDRTKIAETFRKLPSIIVSALVGIVCHIILDNMTHIDDIFNKAIYQAENLGREPEDYHDFYYFMMYGPTLFVSGIGALMAMYYCCVYRKDIWAMSAFFRKYLFRWSVIIILSTISFSMLKHINVGVEDNMRIDSYAISITCGLMSAFLLSPLMFYLFERIRGKRKNKLSDKISQQIDI